MKSTRVRLAGHPVGESNDRWRQATIQLGNWVTQGKNLYRETIAAGIQNAPELFRVLLSRRNFSAQPVKIAHQYRYRVITP